MMKPKDNSMKRISRDAIAATIRKLGITTRAVLDFTFDFPEPNTPRGWSYTQGLAELKRLGHIEIGERFIKCR